jgi:hypothetical protein
VCEVVTTGGRWNRDGLASYRRGMEWVEIGVPIVVVGVMFVAVALSKATAHIAAPVAARDDEVIEIDPGPPDPDPPDPGTQRDARPARTRGRTGIAVAAIAIALSSVVATIIVGVIGARERADLRTQIKTLTDEVDGIDSDMQRAREEIDHLRYRISDMDQR